MIPTQPTPHSALWVVVLTLGLSLSSVAQTGSSFVRPTAFDLRSQELVLSTADSFWQVTGATLAHDSLTLDVVGRVRGDGDALGIAPTTRIVTFDSEERVWELLRAEGLEIGAPRAQAEVMASLVFAAPPHVFSGFQLELATVGGASGRLPMSLPGALQVREQLQRGAIAYDAGQWQPAVQAYRSAVRGRPNHVEGWRGLGRCLVRMRQNEESVEVLRIVVRQDPESAYDHALLGFALLDVSEAEAYSREAKEHLLRAAELGYDWEELGFFIGRTHELLGEVEEARSAFMNYLQVGRSQLHRAHAEAFLVRTKPRAPVEPVSGREPGSRRETVRPAVTEDGTTGSEGAGADGTPAAAARTPGPAGTRGHVELPLPDVVADFGRDRILLQRLYAGPDSWILRTRFETAHLPGDGTRLTDNLGMDHPLVSLDERDGFVDLTFGVPRGKARTVTLHLVDPKNEAQGDCTFSVPGYDSYREAMLEGNRALFAGDHAAAEAAYSRALPYRAGDEGGWWRRGIARLRIGKEAEATTDLARAAELAAENADIHAALGEALLASGRTADAIDALARARELGGDSPEILLQLGRACAVEGDTGRARRAFEEVIERYPGGSQAAAAREQLRALGGE